MLRHPLCGLAFLLVLFAQASRASDELCEFDGVWRLDVDTSLGQTQWYRGGESDVSWFIEEMAEIFGQLHISDAGVRMYFAGSNEMYSPANVTQNGDSLALRDESSGSIVHRFGCDTFGVYRDMRLPPYSTVRLYFGSQEES